MKTGAGARATIATLARDEGELFGSIGPAQIAEAINHSCNSQVLKSEVRLPEGPLSRLGEFEIILDLGCEVEVVVMVEVVSA